MTIGAERKKEPRSWSSGAVLRRVPAILLPMLALTLIGAAVVWVRDRARDRSLARQRSVDVVRLHTRVIERELASIGAILLHFAEQRILRDFLADASTRATIEEEYIRFCRATATFDQLRLIDGLGHEALRVNYEAGEPRAVPEAELQSKGNRYYVRLTRTLEQGRIYVSPFDLNLERGRVEEPWKPVLRIGTPVWDDRGVRRGTLLFNYLGQRLLERLSDASSNWPGQAWLVNAQGYYLEGPDRARSWAFHFGAEPTFAGDHPRAWRAMRATPDGEVTTADGVFSFATVRPSGPLGEVIDSFPEGLRVVSFLPEREVYAASETMLGRLLLGNVAVAAILALIAWRVAYLDVARKRHEEQLAVSEVRLRALSRRLMEAQETERKRIARDLHDDLGQVATAVVIDLQRARKSAGGPGRQLVERALESAEGLLASTHRLSAAVRSSVLDDLGLRVALSSLCDELEERAEVAVRADLRFEDSQIGDTIAESVYRLVQEALTNTARHAQASEVSVEVEVRGDVLELCVRDDGVGFDPSEVDEGHFGLLGMRERVELLRGSLRVESTPEGGTTLRVQLPVERENTANEGGAA